MPPSKGQSTKQHSVSKADSKAPKMEDHPRRIVRYVALAIFLVGIPLYLVSSGSRKDPLLSAPLLPFPSADSKPVLSSSTEPLSTQPTNDDAQRFQLPQHPIQEGPEHFPGTKYTPGGGAGAGAALGGQQPDHTQGHAFHPAVTPHPHPQNPQNPNGGPWGAGGYPHHKPGHAGAGVGGYGLPAGGGVRPGGYAGAGVAQPVGHGGAGGGFVHGGYATDPDPQDPQPQPQPQEPQPQEPQQQLGGWGAAAGGEGTATPGATSGETGQAEVGSIFSSDSDAGAMSDPSATGEPDHLTTLNASEVLGAGEAEGGADGGAGGAGDADEGEEAEREPEDDELEEGPDGDGKKEVFFEAGPAGGEGEGSAEGGEGADGADGSIGMESGESLQVEVQPQGEQLGVPLGSDPAAGDAGGAAGGAADPGAAEGVQMGGFAQAEPQGASSSSDSGSASFEGGAAVAEGAAAAVDDSVVLGESASTTPGAAAAQLPSLAEAQPEAAEASQAQAADGLESSVEPHVAQQAQPLPLPMPQQDASAPSLTPTDPLPGADPLILPSDASIQTGLTSQATDPVPAHSGLSATRQHVFENAWGGAGGAAAAAAEAGQAAAGLPSGGQHLVQQLAEHAAHPGLAHPQEDLSSSEAGQAGQAAVQEATTEDPGEEGISLVPEPAPVATPAAAAPAEKSPCQAGGCSGRGTCNLDTLQCDCPFGWGGYTCEQPLFPACRFSPDSEVFFVGTDIPRPCECLRQAAAHFCPSEEECTWSGHKEARCWEFTSPPPLLTSSPPDPADTTVKYQIGFDAKNGEIKESTAEEVLSLGPPGGPRLVPLEQCPSSCGGRGACVFSGDAAQCVCLRGYNGAGCENVEPAACLNGCSGRGECVGGGFCKCSPPYFGLDCGRTKGTLDNAEGLTESKTSLRVFIYDLPADVSYPVQTRLFANPDYEAHYGAWRLFLEKLSAHKAVRTESPHEANLFYIPVQWPPEAFEAGSAFNTGQLVVNALAYIREMYAGFLEKAGGRNHVLFLPHDRAACPLFPPGAVPDAEGLIRMAHFGLGGEGGCFDASKDVVVPPPLSLPPLPAYASDPFTPPGRKPILAFWAGDAHPEDPLFSGGARSELVKAFGENGERKRADFIVVDGRIQNYLEMVAASTFCLDMYGVGWTDRLGLFVGQGCIPVVIQDYVAQPFENLIKYEDFSLRLTKADIPRLAEILGGVSAEEIKRLQIGLRNHYKAFYYKDGLAYRYTLQGLAKSLQAYYAAATTSQASQAETQPAARRSDLAEPLSLASSSSGQAAASEGRRRNLSLGLLSLPQSSGWRASGGGILKEGGKRRAAA